MPPKTPVKKAPPAKGAAPAKGAPPANGAPAAKGAPANKKPPPANEKGKAPPKEGAAISQCRKQLNIPKKSGGPQKTINVEEVVGWALHGKVGCDYPDTAKIVRIFTSSTFTDTRAERNALMARVYPKLREYCRERGYDFQVVDMRWGVRDEATDDHLTSDLCMRELRKCQRLSTGPNFITFLAQKYGYRPFPPKIDAVEFEKILSGVSKADDKKLLTDWFIRDDNIVPPLYQLTPIRQKLPDYANDENPELKSKARGEWWGTFEKMQVILRDASSKQLDEKTAHKYYWAVTEEEVYNGILAVDNADTACYWFKRTLTGLKENTGHKPAYLYMDMANGKPDEEALNLLTKLKDKSVANQLKAENITDYTVKWTEKGVDVEFKEHAEYIDVFCSDFEKVLTSMIDNGIEAKAEQDIKDSLALETMGHAQFAMQKCAMFHGRGEFLKQLKSKITLPKNSSPIVICGEPGAGKTSVMAKVASLVSSWFDDGDGEDDGNLKVILRFLGTSTSSSSTKELLRSLCSQIHQVNGQKGRIQLIPKAMKELKEYFTELLEEQSERIVLILDSLDQLRDFGAKLRGWIPKTLPDDVTLLLSCIPGEEFVVGPELKKYLPETCYIDLPHFSEDDINEVLAKWLQTSGRALQEPQHKLLVDACKACALPLFAKLSYDSAVRWRSHQDMKECILGTAVDDSIELLFDRIEKYHGVVLVKRALGYVTAAKSGLSTNEIEDILSLDDVVLNDVYQYHTPPLRRLPPLIWVRIQDELDQYLITAGAEGLQVVTWYHRQFHATARKRYLTDEAKTDLYGNISEYFRGLWAEGKKKDYVDRKGNKGSSDRIVPAMPYIYKTTGEGEHQYNLRKMAELPHALTMSGDVEALKQYTFLNFDFLYNKLKALSLESIFEDLDFAKESGVDDPDIEMLYDCMEMSRDSLMLTENLLPSCLLGRLGGKKDNPAIGRLLNQAARPHFDCLYSSQGTMKLSGGPTLGKFVGHEGLIQGMAISKDDKFFVSTCSDGTLRVWDVAGIKEEKVIELVDEESGISSDMITITALVNEDKWVACLSIREIGLFDLETGVYIKTIYPEMDDEYDFMRLGDLCWSEEHKRLFLMQGVTIDVWDIFEGKKVDAIKTGAREEPEDENENNTSHRDFVGAYQKDIMYYKTHSNVAKIVRYGTQKKTDSYALEPKKDIPDRNFKFAVMSSGFLLCYNIKVPRKHGVVTTGSVDVIDIATATRLHVFKDIDMGYLMTLEIVVATGPDTFCITNFPNGTTAIYVGDVRKKTLTQVMTMMATFPHRAIATQKNQLIFFYMTNMMVMEFLDLTIAGAGGGEDGMEEPEMYWIVGPVPGTSRYLFCTTITHAIGLWDLYERRCVRIIDTDFTNMFGCLLNTTTVVGASYHDGHLYSANVLQGQVNWKKDKILFKICDGQIRMGLSHAGHIVLVGPKATTLCGVDPKTGKIAWTVDAGTEKLGGVLVSENGMIALCETPIPSGSLANSGPKKPSKIHVFDLKAKKKLPDLKYKPTQNPLRTALEMSKMAFLTPEGDYYCVAIADGDYQYMLYSTKDGKSRQIALKEGEHCSGFLYSRQLKSAVMVLQNGEFVISAMKDLKITRFRVPKPTNCLLSSISYDGQYVACNDGYTRNICYVFDVVKKTPFACYVADNEVAMTYFSRDNHFLLVASRTNPGLSQLCLYEANKGQKSPKEEGATAGPSNGKPAEKTPAKGGRVPPKTENKAKAPEGAGNKQKKGGEMGDDSGPTLERQYLDMLGAEKDLYGQPKKMDLREEKK